MTNEAGQYESRICGTLKTLTVAEAMHASGNSPLITYGVISEKSPRVANKKAAAESPRQPLFCLLVRSLPQPAGRESTVIESPGRAGPPLTTRANSPSRGMMQSPVAFLMAQPPL